MILIIIFFIVNLIICSYFYQKEEGIIHAPFILSIMALTTMTPMLYMILESPNYSSSSFIRTSIFMTMSHLAFSYGYIQALKVKEGKNENLRVFLLERTLITMFFFIALGFIGLRIYKMPLSRELGQWVIAAQFMNFDVAALTIAIIFGIYAFQKGKYRWLSILLLILSSWPIYDYAMNVKGSRSRVFFLLLLYCFLLLKLYPTKERHIKRFFVLLFIIGTILSASIVEYRSSITSDKSFYETKFIENFKKGFDYRSISKNGMDLGNCALGMEYCADNFHYSYGAIFIDRLLFNYVPGRLIGQKQKEALMLSPKDIELERSYTHNVTTMTGYYEAFNCFSYLGILIFAIVGYFMGYLFRKKETNTICLISYLFNIIYANVLISHGVTYFISNYVFLLIFIVPILLIISQKLPSKLIQ